MISPEEFQQLPEPERKRIETEVMALQQQLQVIMRQAPQWEREGREKAKALNHEVAIFAVGQLIEEMRKKYAALPQVVEQLSAMQQDVIENVEVFLNPPETQLSALMGIPQAHLPKGSAFFRRYEVNLLVDHSASQGAPVVYEDNPTYQNLVGQVEYIAQMGALSTDFNLIRAGALHKANGGYLVLDAIRVIPASNVKHLMLRQDVVEAVKADKFNVYPVEAVDQGIAILTGIEAGERDNASKFPEGSVNQRVEARLIELAEKRKAESQPLPSGSKA